MKARFLRSVLEGLPASLKVIDRERRLVYTNGKARRMPFSPLDDLRGRQCHMAFFGNPRKCLYCPMEVVFKDGVPHSVTVSMLVDGVEREYEIAAYPLKDEDGVTVYAAEVVKDVTPYSKGVAFERKVGKLFTQDLSLSQLFDHMVRWAPLTDPVWIEGERGTGKKMVAQSLHQMGGRPGPFHVFHCYEGTPDGNGEGLFGAGAAWDQARGGTLYIEEVVNLGEKTQRELLRRLNQKGGESPPRVIVATRTDIRAKTKEGLIHEDMYKLFSVRLLRIPPLRERRRDLPVLAQHFIDAARARNGSKAERLGPHALSELLRYDWPGNMRELETRLEGACLLSEGPEIATLNLQVPEEKTEKLQDQIARLEKTCLTDALCKAGGRLDKTAALTGLNLKTLQRKLKKHGLKPRRYKSPDT